MIRRRGRVARTLALLGSAGPTIGDGVRGLWRGESGRKWMVPLLVYLGVRVYAPKVISDFGKWLSTSLPASVTMTRS